MSDELRSGPDEDFRQQVIRCFPHLPFLGRYRGRVVRQKTDANGNMVCDLEVESDEMPSPAGYRLKLGIPGAVVDLLQTGSGINGAHAALAFEDGSAGKPYITEWENGTTPPAKLIFNALSLFLGGEQLAEPTVMGATYRTQEAALNQQIIALATAAAAACSSPALAPLAPFFSGLASALQAFEAQSAAYLTTVAKVK